jgi:hypothetical protein
MYEFVRPGERSRLCSAMASLRFLIVTVLIACGSAGGNDGDDDGTAPDAGNEDSDASMVDADPGSPDSSIECAAQTTACGASCVDLTTSNDHCGQCETACDAGETCEAGTCKPGHAAVANGTCTYVDQPGWLSCPTGMSCRCYYRYTKLFENAPARLDVWISDTAVEVRGGMLPNNQTLNVITPTTIPLAGTPPSGAASSFSVVVDGAVEIELRKTSGYVPAKYVLYSSADCGNQGKRLECTFR